MRRNTNRENDQNDEDADVPSTDNEREEQDETNERPSVLRRFCNHLAFFKYVFIVLLIPPILNYGALKREQSALLPEGEKVDLGWGQRLFISCKGEGLPTVILDAPTGSSSDIWLETQKHVAEYTQVCIYDRSGIGFSDLPFLDITAHDEHSNARRYVAQPSSVQQMVDDLNYLITKAKPLPRPFVMVGSEVGSLAARYYAHLYKKDVVGILLVDPLTEDMFTIDRGAWAEYWYYHLLPSLQSLHLAAMLGLSRLALLVGWLHPPLHGDNLPQEVVLRQKYLLSNPAHMNAVFNEHLFMNASFAQMSDLLRQRSFPSSVSVAVIHSDYYEKYPENLSESWKKSQKHLIENLHHGCSHKTVEGEEHRVLYSNPVAIVGQILELIKIWQEQQKISLSFVD